MPTEPHADDLITLAVASAILGCDVKTLRRRISENALPAQRFGPKMIRVRRGDVAALGRPMQHSAAK